MQTVILSGGSGTRLWPVSRADLPKQFCDLLDQPLQSLTLGRCREFGTPWVVTSKTLKTLTEMNLASLQLQSARVIYEPIAKNTAAAIALVCYLLSIEGRADEIAAVFPSDHLIRDENKFKQIVTKAASVAESGKVVVLGMNPSYPETGYGYIQIQPDGSEILDHAHPVVRFHEKPNQTKAEEFIKAGSYFWNAGIFVFKVRHMIQLFERHSSNIWTTIKTLRSDLANIDIVYKQLESISIDFAIMEKLNSQDLSCIPCEIGWNDVGSWDAIADLASSGSGKELLFEDSARVHISGLPGKSYAVVGIEDLILVDTRDALLAIKKGKSQNVRRVVERLQATGSSLVKSHPFERRPWGEFEVLRDEGHFKSKIIRVLGGQQISYQSHAQREEHWIVVRGNGEVILNDQTIVVKPGTYIHIPLGAKHRIRNTGSTELEFVEVQLGTYFGEDDIIRYQDDYKRL